MTIKRIIPIVIVLSLIMISAYSFLLPNYRSSDMTSVTTEETVDDLTITTTSYQTKDGKTVTASDKGYARIRKTSKSGKVILEEYQTPDGVPAVLSAGYSAISRAYDDQGLNTEIVYLDEDMKPVSINSGYDSIRRSYNDKHLADTDTYWKAGAQITRKEGYAQLVRIYGFEISGTAKEDAKRVLRQEYRDLGGDLVKNSSGYAFYTRVYNAAGKVSEMHYFDEEGNPALLSIGQSGYIRRYDEQDRTIETTYLGVDGHPINTVYGYATVKTEYIPITRQNGGKGVAQEVVTKTLYYDKDGSPVTAGRSQYGVLSTGRGETYLNEDGETVFRLDNILLNNQSLVIVLGVLAVLAGLLARGKGRVVFLILYLAFIFYMTMWYREAGITRSRAELFWSYRQFFTSRSLRAEILNNIYLFIPFSVALCSMLLEKMKGNRAVILTVLTCFVLSVLIEVVQLIARIGLAELDDIVSNTLGGVVGAAISEFYYCNVLPATDANELKK